MKPGKRFTNEEIKARIVMIVAIGLTASFVGSVFTILYGLLFVSQPASMAELDAALLRPGRVDRGAAGGQRGLRAADRKARSTRGAL